MIKRTSLKNSDKIRPIKMFFCSIHNVLKCSIQRGEAKLNRTLIFHQMKIYVLSHEC